jgi:hypothetical protein
MLKKNSGVCDSTGNSRFIHSFSTGARRDGDVRDTLDALQARTYA